MNEQRAALCLRVSTGRQAEHDLSIPDRRRQLDAYCRNKGWRIVAEYVAPGASATDDRRPELQRMMQAATETPPGFDVIVVHSFELGFHLRRLNKHGVKLASRTRELGDDSTSVLMRRIMALFDGHQWRQNAKHVLRSMEENARQGFWSSARPPLGYRAVAVEQRGVRVEKRLEIDPIRADTVRLMFRLALTGGNGSGPLGVKAIANPMAQLRTAQDEAQRKLDLATRDGTGANRWRSPSTASINSRPRRGASCGRRTGPTGATTCPPSRSTSWRERGQRPAWERRSICRPPFRAQDRRRSACPDLLGVGAPERIRTPNPQIRSLVLYPVELRALAGGRRDSGCPHGGQGPISRRSCRVRARPRRPSPGSRRARDRAA